VNHIKESVERVIDHYTENPGDARGPGTPVTAVMEDGLRCRVETPDGTTIVTDMPTGIGGGGSAPSPGRLFRAALASCDATFVTLRAARVGIKLTTLEVIWALMTRFQLVSSACDLSFASVLRMQPLNAFVSLSSGL